MRKFYVCLVLSLLLNFTFFSLFLETQSKNKRSSQQEDNVSISPCVNALEQRAVCAAANSHGLDIMRAAHLEAVTVIQDVRTGALVAFAASQPSEVDVTTPVAPLSVAKLLLAASWWDNHQPNVRFDNTKGTATTANPAYRSSVSVHEMLVGGSDSAGREMAVALRRSVGTKKVLKDLRRYGFGQQTNSLRDGEFWGELASTWETRLITAPAYVSLCAETKDAEWAEALSIGETNMSVTALNVSRFLQAVGNSGVMLTPVAREEQSTPTATKSPTSDRQLTNSIRIMQERTALRLQSAMRDTVQRGTANSIAQALKDTGWQIGGKTGSGTALLPKGVQLDGWFAGLLFDPDGQARFTVATFVRSGGYGGENAAKISAELARYIMGEPNTLLRK
jgi:cell division protein FtsI/penicillin-binding protein 2